LKQKSKQTHKQTNKQANKNPRKINKQITIGGNWAFSISSKTTKDDEKQTNKRTNKHSNKQLNKQTSVGGDSAPSPSVPKPNKDDEIVLEKAIEVVALNAYSSK
jgi:hypothetical protein